MIRAWTQMALTVAFLSLCAYGAAEESSFSSGLMSLNSETRISTVQQAQTERNKRVNDLIAIVETKDVDVTENGTLVSAIGLLSVYRAREAVTPLAQRLMFLPTRTERTFSEQRSTQYSYPCAAALVNIGEPSDVVQAMTNIITTSDKAEERELATWVIMQIKDKAPAVTLLQNGAQSPSAGPQTKRRLAAAAKYLQGFKPTFSWLFARPDGSIEEIGGVSRSSEPMPKPVQPATPAQPPTPAS